MKKFHKSIVFAGALLAGGPFSPSRVVSQESPCDNEEALVCFNRIVREELGRRTAVEAQDVAPKSRMRLDEQTQDRISSASAGANVSGTQNFLPALIASLGIDGVEDENGDLRLTYNFEQNGLGNSSLEAIVRKPEIFEPLLSSFPETSRGDLQTNLSGQLADLDDFEARLMLGFRIDKGGWRVGRDLGQYSEMRNALFRGNVAGLKDQPAADDTESMRAVLQAGLSSSTDIPNREQAIIIQQAAVAVAQRHTALAQYLEDNHYYRFADLVANQPQLYLTASVRDRTDLTGPDEWSIKFSSELTRGNFNGFNQKCEKYKANEKDTEDDKAKKDKELQDCFKDFLEENEAAIRHGWRFKLDVEYGETDAYAPQLQLPEALQTALAGAELPDLKETSHWMGALTLGRSLKVRDSTEVSRFDLEAKYEDVTGDPMRQARFVSTATVTQRINDDVLVSTSAVYANRPQYRGEVDQEFSMRAGIRFKVNRKAKKESAAAAQTNG